MTEIHKILEYCMQNDLTFSINPHTVVVSWHNGYSDVKVESFWSGVASETKVLHYIPLREMLNEIKKETLDEIKKIGL